MLSCGEMALNNTEKEKFFAKSIPVSVKDEYTNQTRTRHLFLTMEWQDSSPTMYSRKVLVLSLTDNDDPFFLYNLHLSEDDFQMLKENQNLLINFASFPQHIIDYIEKCLLEEKNPQPRFVFIFTMNEKLGSVSSPSQLDIIETIQFKHLTHLSLKFIAATETIVRQYLITLFRSLKEENRLLKNNLSFLEEDSKNKLATFQMRLSGREEELNDLRKEMKVQLDEKDTQHALNLEEERNRLISRHKKEENRLEEEKKNLEHNFRKQSQQLESRVTSLDTLNKELQDKNVKQECSIRKQSSKILTLENEVRELKETIQSLERKCEKLKSDLSEKESVIHHKEGNLSIAKRELKTKSQTITELEDQINVNVKEVKNLNEELERLKLQIEVLERHKVADEDDKHEMEKIIRKLQDKQKEANAKCERYARYKAIVEEKEKLLSDLRKEIAELNRNLEAKNTEIQTLNDHIIGFNQKINSLEKDCFTKDNVIKFLNNQLTKNCIIPHIASPENLETSPSSVAQEELAKISSVAHRKSMGSDNSPKSLTTANNPSQKSVRIDRSTPSTVRNNSSTPARFYMTDSAYCTSPSNFTHQVMPDNLLPVRVCTFDDEYNDIDPEALSGAFGEGNRILKHSTAKKSTKPTRPITAKPTKKR